MCTCTEKSNYFHCKISEIGEFIVFGSICRAHNLHRRTEGKQLNKMKSRISTAAMSIFIKIAMTAVKARLKKLLVCRHPTLGL